MTTTTMMKMLMCEWFEKGMEWVQHLPSTALLWTTCLGFVSATILVLFSLQSKSRNPDTILLTGLRGSGKTLLFHQLRDGFCEQDTVHSQEPNEGRFILHSETTWSSRVRPVHVVDLPGDFHLHSSIMDGFLHKAAGIVFTVDATDISWNCHSVSNSLYEILTNTIVLKRKIPLLILCNKTDKLTAHSKEFIASLLEKAIDKRNTDSNIDSRRKKFSFSDCHTQVTVSEASGLTGDIAQLENFIRRYVTY